MLRNTRNLGFTISITDVTVPTTLVDYQEGECDSLSAAKTAFVFLIPPPSILPGFLLRPYCSVSIGNANIGVNYEADLGVGRVFSINGSACRINLLFDGGGPVLPVPLTAGAFLGAGAHPSVEGKRTFYFDTLAVGASTPLRPVPPFAVDASLVGPFSTQMAFRLAFFTLGGTLIVEANSQLAAGQSVTVPIPADAYFYSVTNVSGGGVLATGRIVFGLSV